MARPPKRGLDYFPFDVGFFDEAVMVTVSGKFGVKGESVVMRLLCAIFKNGYYALWDDPLRYKLRKDVPGTSPGYLDGLVEYLAASGFFDECLFRQAQCLTSRGIQERYFKAVERRKKPDGEYPYLLVPAYTNPGPADVSACRNPTKESKVNKEEKKEKEDAFVIGILGERGCPDPEGEYLRLVRWNDGRHIRSGGWSAMDDAAKAEAARLWRFGGKPARGRGVESEAAGKPDMATVEEECARWLEDGTTSNAFARHDRATRDAVNARLREMVRSGVKSRGLYLKRCYARDMGEEKFRRKYGSFVDMSDIDEYL